MAQILSKIKTGFYLLPSQSDVTQTRHNPAEAQKKLHKELDQWLSESSILAEATAPPNQYERLTTKLKIQYHGAVCLLNQPSQAISKPGDKSLRYCFNSTAERLRLYEKLYETGTLCHSWSTVQDLFLAGATVMYCVCISSDVRNSVSLASLAQDFRSCSSMLSIGGEWWPIIRKARASLERLANRTLEMFAEKTQSETDKRRVMPQFRSDITGNFGDIISDERLGSADLEEALVADFNHEAQLAHIFDNMPMAGMVDGGLEFSWDNFGFDEHLWINANQDQLSNANLLSEDNNDSLLDHM